MRDLFNTSLARWCPCLTIFLFIGCGGTTAEVSGRVEFVDGSPIQGGVRNISFIPTDDTTAKIRSTASGRIEDDGSFKLQGRRPTDGVQKGQYTVTIMALKDPRLGGLLVPEKYTVPKATPFKVDVTADKDDYLFQLDKLE